MEKLEEQQKQFQDGLDLRQQLITKQENYIFREQEYRQTIQQLKDEIKKNSNNPLVVPSKKSENTLPIEGGQLEINKDQTEKEESLKQSKVYTNLTEVKNINAAEKEIRDNIELMQQNAGKNLKTKREKLWKGLDEELAKYKENLRKANEKRQGNDQATDKDKSNKETLETMSSMAQKIDEENQQLMKKN